MREVQQKCEYIVKKTKFFKVTQRKNFGISTYQCSKIQLQKMDTKRYLHRKDAFLRLFLHFHRNSGGEENTSEETALTKERLLAQLC